MHINSLTDLSNRGAVRNALEMLPAGVNATYDLAMERIAMQSECDRELAERVLAWISFAYRPLSLNELQIALSVSAGMSTINSYDFEDELILTSVCAGLVVIDETSDIIRLVRKYLYLSAQFQSEGLPLADHTAQEYFQARRTSLFPHAEASIVATCLIYILGGDQG